MSLFVILENVKKTIGLLTAPISAIIVLWFNKDVGLYVGATAGLIVSIIDYIELFIKENRA
jgi:hypothetical protein